MYYNNKIKNKKKVVFNHQDLKQQKIQHSYPALYHQTFNKIKRLLWHNYLIKINFKKNLTVQNIFQKNFKNILIREIQ